MSKIFRVTCYVHNKNDNQPTILDETEISLDELEITDIEWNNMTWQERSKLMELVALQNISWGYQEIKDQREVK